MLSDGEAYQLLLDNYNQFYRDSTHRVFMLDPELRFIALNRAWIDVWQPEYIDQDYSRGEKLPMFQFLPIDHDVRQYAECLYEKIIQTQKSTSVLGINFFRKPEFTSMVFHVDVLVNHDSGNLIGLWFKAEPLYRDLSWINLPKLLRQVFDLNCYAKDSTQYLTKTAGNQSLDARAHEILFLMFHFSTYEEIACILSLKSGLIITKNSVGKYVRRVLYPQFSVIDNEGLKQAAAKLGYDKKIPPSLIHPVVIDLHQT